MPYSTISPRLRLPRVLRGASFVCLVTLWLLARPVAGAEGPALDLQEVLARVQRLEARVNALEEENRTLASALASRAPRPAASPENAESSAPKPSASAVAPTRPVQAAPAAAMQPDSPRLQIRGFADVRYGTSDLEGDSDSFGLGQFNLFLTSKLSDPLSVLAEVVIEADPFTNEFAIELERLLLNYRYSDALHVGFGRYHTAIGFYNTAYHHSSWLQTTVDRPFLFDFEDDGGILPIHNVGVTATGRIPSGGAGLHYVAEVGNGRAARTELGQDPVQNVTDENRGKSVNLALLARPDAVRGLELGASWYHDNLTPLESPDVSENILSLHAVYQRPTFEFLNEVVLIRHEPDGGAPRHDSTGFYTQLSRQWSAFRPYFRYEYVDVPDEDPIYPDIGRQSGPLFGLRYDWGDYTALKVQYGHVMRRLEPSFNTLTLQAAFTF